MSQAVKYFPKKKGKKDQVITEKSNKMGDANKNKLQKRDPRE